MNTIPGNFRACHNCRWFDPVPQGRYDGKCKLYEVGHDYHHLCENWVEAENPKGDSNG